MANADLFTLRGKPIVITGGAGLLGMEHARAVSQAGGIPVLLDRDSEALEKFSQELEKFGHQHLIQTCDTTSEAEMEDAERLIFKELGMVYGIVNNVARNPPMSDSQNRNGSLADTSVNSWERDHAISLSSVLLTSKIFGKHLESRREGVIVNIASDLALISPDQRIYESVGVPSFEQPKKPMSYSSTKAALIGITKYLSTYWAPLPIRANALVPGSVRGGQSPELIRRLENLIPLGRLAEPDEYQGALIFLLSDASRYMTGATLVMDGGRTAW